MLKVELDTAVANYKAILCDAHKKVALWEAGLSWYDDAQKEAMSIAIEQIQPVIKGDVTRSLRLAAALLACASPAKSWEQGVNQMVARRWAAQMGAGIKATGHMGAFNTKAQALWDYVVAGNDDIEVNIT